MPTTLFAMPLKKYKIVNDYSEADDRLVGDGLRAFNEKV